jgi:DNA polymerase-3 subunit delta'
MSPRGARPRPALSAAVRFAAIRGQERAIGFLRRAWEQDRLAHAYLFTGPAGVGKLATARALALGLHCEVAPFDGCGTCPACRTIGAGTNADVRIITGPLRDRRDISIEQVRELQHGLGYCSLSAHPKIGIINDAEGLTLQAQNALLKTLEEPAGSSLLVLVAVNATSLTSTILSRCQRLIFDPLSTQAVTEVLERHGRSGMQTAALAAYAEGSAGRALALDAEFFGTRRREILDRLRGLRGRGFKHLTDFAQELSGEDADLTLVLTVIASWYRDALHRAVLGPGATLQNADLSDQLPVSAAADSLRNLETTYGTITSLRQNANRSLALVRMLLRLTE